MKYLFVLLFLVVGAFSSKAQQWKELSQAPINLKYQIPQGWYVGGLVQVKECNCTAATINTAKDRSINMVIFSTNESDIQSLQSGKIWGYSFAPTSSNPEELKTEYFNFEKSLSTWNEDKDSAVLRFSTSNEEFRYLIYFWGDFEALTSNASIIEKILNSLRNL